MDSWEVQKIVSDSIKQKFAGRYVPQAEVKRAYPTYDEAKAAGDVSGMLSNRLGLPAIAEKRARMEEEYQSQAIGSWRTELSGLDSKMEGVQKEMDDTMAKLKEDLAIEREAQERKILKSGIQPGSLRHMVFLSEYERRQDDLENHATIQAFQTKLDGYAERKSELHQHIMRFTTQHQETIQALRREQVRQNIINSGLLDE